jgi:hypothetical protein
MKLDVQRTGVGRRTTSASRPAIRERQLCTIQIKPYVRSYHESASAACVFRRSRAGIPEDAGPPFRFMPGRVSEAV